VNAADHVRYLGIYFDHKLVWDKHIAVKPSRTKGTIKALQLLGNSVRGLDHGNWRLAYNGICLPALTYGGSGTKSDASRLVKQCRMQLSGS
jgi:hypothetical protein